MKDLEEILRHINKNSEPIIDKLDDESIVVYEFIKNEFGGRNVIENYLFQFVFRSFYRLDSAGLTKEWKTRYFELMEKYRKVPPDLKELVTELSILPTIKGYNSIQFSFATKLLNTLNEDKPIYDSFIALVFGFNAPTTSNKSEKTSRYIEFYDSLEKNYSKIIKEKLLDTVLQKFDDKFANNSLGQIKKLDFIFWAAGKII